MHTFLLGLAVAFASFQSDSVPLYDNLGDHHYSVTTSSPRAQAYFDQGLRLYYAFNHAEAVRSFREAQRLDPSCAMCFWGEAMAYGPNINLPMDSASGVAAYAATQRALAALDDETELERSLVRAIEARYAAVPPADRAALDSAYARAMAAVARRNPADHEAAVLYAESLMDLRPWNYWTEDARLQPGMEDALGNLERVVAADPEHPGACHFFIHAVEEKQPERAVPCAERLADLMPGAGHLVHMPGHIYIRVGRYADAIRQNQHAVHADETYIQDQRPGFGMYTGGYYPHNYDFLAFGAAMAGRSDLAIESAEKVASLIPREMLGTPGMGFLQHWLVRPVQMRVRFARWDEILAAPAPPEGLPHAEGIWRYGRGRAFAAKGDFAAAEAELERLRAIRSDPAIEGLKAEFNEARQILGVAEHVLAGHIASAQGDHARAVTLLTEAVRLEDEMYYGEPPEWSIPARYDLGMVLLEAGRPAEAERAFRQDLDHFRENGWSLAGLERALREQGRTQEAQAVASRMEQAFAEADVEI